MSNQPGGHIETGCEVECGELIGVYLWIHPQTRQQFLRLAYEAKFISCDEDHPLDDGIIARRWATLQELEARQPRLRSPAVIRCVRDFAAGKRQFDALLSGMLPLQQNVHQILTTADLV